MRGRGEGQLWSSGEFVQLSCSPLNAPGWQNTLVQKCWEPAWGEQPSSCASPRAASLCHHCLAGSTGVRETRSPRHHPLGPVKCLSGLPVSSPRGPGRLAMHPLIASSTMLTGLQSSQRFFLCTSVSGTPPAGNDHAERECLCGRSVYTITSHGMTHETGWWFPVLLCQLAPQQSIPVLPDCLSFHGLYLVGWRSPVQQGAGISW